jgi:hypothetical protein
VNTPNTTFAVYLAGRLPPATPDFSGQFGFLRDRWERGNKVNEEDRTGFWTATLDVPLGSDLPDLWPGAVSQTTIWTPDQNGDAYTVVFVERERAIRGSDFLRVYLVKGYVVAITVKEADGNPTLTAITTLIFDQADGFVVSQPAANQAQVNLNITEQAQDAVGNAMINTNTVHPFYDDPNNQLSWNVQLQMSLTSDGSGVKLVGDAASPGNSQYYGTDGSGSKGYHALPSAVTQVSTGNGLTGGPITSTGTLSVVTQMSVDLDGSGVKLKNDSASPGNSMLYGTNSSGVKGWYAQPAGGTVSTADSVQGDGSSGNKIQLVNDSAAPGNSQFYGTNASGTKGWLSLPNSTSTMTQGTTHSITSSNGTFEDTGLSVTLPSAGTYLLLATVHGVVNFSAGSAGLITARLRNSTDSADLNGSDTLVVCGTATSQGFQGSGTIVAFFTCAASKTIKLYAKRDLATTWTTSNVASDSNGDTYLGYVKLSN